MRGALPRRGFLALIAAVAGAAEGLHDLPALDPVAAAERAALAASEQATSRTSAAFLAAQSASARAPRCARAHLLAAELARGCNDLASARREVVRAARTDPFHGELQHAVANDLLVAAVEQQDRSLLDGAAQAFAAAVQVGALDGSAAFAALTAASAPPAAFDLVAGKDPRNLELLIEEHARSLACEAALAVAERLDQQRADPHQRARALAERRLGAAFFAAGRGPDAVLHFDRAAQRMEEPDALCLDRADAAFLAGAPAQGALHLLRALLRGTADPARAAGSLRSAPSVECTAAFFQLADATPDATTRRRAAAVFAELGDRSRQRELQVHD